MLVLQVQCLSSMFHLYAQVQKVDGTPAGGRPELQLLALIFGLELEEW